MDLFNFWDLDIIVSSNKSSQILSGIFNDMPPQLSILLCIFYGIVSSCAIIGNFLIVWIFCRSPRMRNVNNYFIANLSITDMIIGAFAVPFKLQTLLFQRWDLPFFLCRFCPTVTTASVNVSIFTMTIIAVDRYRAIVYPLQIRSTRNYTKSIISGIWFLALFLAIPTWFAYRVETLFESEASEFVPTCTSSGHPRILQQLYNFSLFVFQYLLPVTIVILVYIRIAAVIKKDKTEENGYGLVRRSGNVRRKREKVIRMLFLVMVLFSICWLPWQLCNLLQAVYPEIEEYRHINLIRFACHWLAMSNSCYNPFIYFAYSKNFKREFKSLFGSCCQKSPLRSQK